jgi:hypothetical protein
VYGSVLAGRGGPLIKVRHGGVGSLCRQEVTFMEVLRTPFWRYDKNQPMGCWFIVFAPNVVVFVDSLPYYLINSFKKNRRGTWLVVVPNSLCFFF